MRNPALWPEVYVGRRNYKELIGRFERNYPEEWEDLG